MKKLKIIIPILVFLFILNGCTSEKTPEGMGDEPPEIKVTIEGSEVEYLTLKHFWNEVAHSTADSFFTLVKTSSDVGFADANDGDTVTIGFTEWTPKKLLVEKVFLNENLDEAYIKKNVAKVKTKLEDDKASFKIESEERDLLGYRITTNWGENRAEYAFVVNVE